MTSQTNRFFGLVALLSLTLSLSYCGQKGGLTRPEPSTLAVSNFSSDK